MIFDPGAGHRPLLSSFLTKLWCIVDTDRELRFDVRCADKVKAVGEACATRFVCAKKLTVCECECECVKCVRVCTYAFMLVCTVRTPKPSTSGGQFALFVEYHQVNTFVNLTDLHRRCIIALVGT